MNHPLISVIVPVYNVEKYLEKCILSILHQTYSHLQIILVNDGSVDNSVAICEKYAAKDKRIVFVSQENKGLSAARNTGLHFVKGEYLSFVDSDDYLDADFYETCMREIADNEMLAFGYRKVDVNEKVFYVRRLKKVSSAALVLVSACTKFFRSETFFRLRLLFPENIIFEDVVFAYKCWMSFSKVKVIEYVGYNYLYNPVSITSNAFCKNTDTRFLFERLRQEMISQECCVNDIQPLLFVLSKLNLFLQLQKKKVVSFGEFSASYFANKKIIDQILEEKHMKMCYYLKGERVRTNFTMLCLGLATKVHAEKFFLRLLYCLPI